MNVVIAQAYMPEIKNKDQRVDHSLWLWPMHLQCISSLSRMLNILVQAQSFVLDLKTIKHQ